MPTSGAAAAARSVLERGPATNPLFGAFFEAAQQAGYPLTDDVNGYRQEGFAKFDRNIHRGRRLSAARAYLHPVMNRKNLEVETLAHATKVVFEGKRAVGVEYLRAGRMKRSVEAGEVILCGGAINTPQLLQLSGVGDAAAPAVTRDPRRRRPPGRRGQPAGPPRGLHPVRQQAAGLDRARAGLVEASRSSAPSGCSCASGLGATNHFEGGGFVRSNDDVDYPNLMFHFLPIAIRYDGTSPTKGHGYQVHIGPMYSDARGTVKIRVDRPAGAPVDAVQLPVDRAGPARVGRVPSRWPARSSTSPRFAPFNDGELSPGPSVETEEEILDWVREDAETALHPSCTAKMGVGDDAVLDPTTMRVYDVEGLRVVDASSFPYVTNGNIYAPVMMLAEKAADLIAGNTPLAPVRRALLPLPRGHPALPTG